MDGRMEGWKDGRKDGWKDLKREGWKRSKGVEKWGRGGRRGRERGEDGWIYKGYVQ